MELAKCHIVVVSESEPAAGDEEENNENDDQPQTPKSRKIGTYPIYKRYVVKWYYFIPSF